MVILMTIRRSAFWEASRLVCLAAWLGLLLAGYRSALAQQLPIKSYTTVDGLAHDRVTRIVRDSRGFLWFCTVDGLSRFDGTHFTTYGREQGLPFPFINDLLEAGPGEYWVATHGGGAVRLNLLNSPPPESGGHTQSRFTAYPVGDRPTTNRVRVLHRDRAGRLWAGTEGGLFLLEERKSEARFRHVELGLASPPDHLVQVWALLEDREGSLWMGTSVGLVRPLPDGRVFHYSVDSSSGNQLVRSLLEDREGRIWLNQQMGLLVFKPPPPQKAGNGLRNRKTTARTHNPEAGICNPHSITLPIANGDARRFNSADGLAAERVRALFQSADGRIWVGSTGGLSEFDGERFHSHTAAQGVSGGPINALAEDSAGNLWIGTDLGGALRIARNGFVSFKRADGLPHPWITSIVEAAMLLASAVIIFDRYRVLQMKKVRAALTQSRKLTNELTAQRSELRQANRALELEYAITRILAEARSPVDAMPRMLRAICESTGWQIGVIWNLDPQAHVLHCVDIWHPAGTATSTFEELTRQRVFLPGEGLPVRVLEKGEANWITDLMLEDNFPRTAAGAKEGLRSAFGFPVLLRGEVIGVLEFFSRERREPEADQIKMTSTIGSDIGQLIERTRAEEALRESETRFRTFAETASDAIITIDASGAIVFVNPAAEKVFGHPLADLIGEELTVLMPEYLRRLHGTGFTRYQQTGQRHISWRAIELPGLHRDGHEIPLEISSPARGGRPTRGDSGQPPVAGDLCRFDDTPFANGIFRGLDYYG
jgi:PAS domain S-box-containing protein